MPAVLMSHKPQFANAERRSSVFTPLEDNALAG
jgi:hypothetical protein